MPKRSVSAIILYALFYMCLLLFFRSYVHILTSQTLLTNDRIAILRAVLSPLLLLSGSLFSFTLAISLRKWPLALLPIPIIFIASHPVDKIATLSSGAILVAFAIYFYSYFKSLKLLQKPTSHIAAQLSIGLTLTILAAAMTINVYNSYYKNIIKSNSELSDKMTRYLAYTLSSFNLESQSVQSNDSLGSYSARIVKNRGQLVTLEAVKAEENNLTTKMNISAKPGDKMVTILNEYATKKIKIIIQLYEKQLKILIPLGFFLITQVLFTASSSISVQTLHLTEIILNRFKKSFLN